MINRIRSGGVSSAPSAFDPLSISRAGNVVSKAANQVQAGLEKIELKFEAHEERQAEFGARVASSRAAGDFEAELDQVNQNGAVDGSDYADRAIASYDLAYKKQLEQAGDDERLRTKISERYRLERPEMVNELRKEGRKKRTDYQVYDFERNIDDASQRMSRGRYADPASYSKNYGKGGLIKQFEGFRGSAYWDVNAFRTGYGSDTVTKAGGKIVKVTKDTKVTRADADRDFARRYGEFQNGVKKQIGVDRFNSMNSAQQEALTSIAYNYGSLPRRVTSVIEKGGSASDIADAIRSLGDDNDGINEKRRHIEANVFESGAVGGVDQYGVENYSGQLIDPTKSEEFLDELAALREQIEVSSLSVLDKQKAIDGAAEQLAMSALNAMTQDNPSAALASLRAGHFDQFLEVGKTSKAMFGTEADKKKLLENKIAAEAKVQEKQFKAVADQEYDDWIASEGKSERPSNDKLSVLSMKKQQNARAMPQVWAAENLAKEIDLSNADAFLKELTPSGENYAAEQRAYDAAKKLIDKRKEDAATKREFDEAEATGRPVNTDVKGVPEELDFRFQDLLAENEGKVSSSDIAAFVKKWGALPDSAGDHFAKLMRSESEHDRLFATTAISDISAVRPEALSSLNKRLVDDALSIHSAMDSGASWADARKAADDAHDPTLKNLRSARRKELKPKDIKAAVEEMADDSIFSTPKFTPEAMQELSALFEDSYLRYGDKATATAQTRVAFRAAYAQSELLSGSGDALWGKDAPERLYPFYGDERDSQWHREQLMDDLEDAGIDGYENVFLAPIKSLAGEMVEYEVLGTKDGLLSSITMDHGFQWHPDVEAEKFSAQQESAEETAVAKSRELRSEIKFLNHTLETGLFITADKNGDFKRMNEIERANAEHRLEVLNSELKKLEPARKARAERLRELHQKWKAENLVTREQPLSSFGIRSE